jgi:hypothetical protein
MRRRQRRDKRQRTTNRDGVGDVDAPRGVTGVKLERECPLQQVRRCGKELREIPRTAALGKNEHLAQR